MLSAKEKEILHKIEIYINDTGYSPTLRELCKCCNIGSTSTMQKYLERLESQGYIVRGKFMPRAIGIRKAI